MTVTKALLLLSCLGHLLLWRCDWLLTCLAGGRFSFQAMQDNGKLSAVIGSTPLKNSMRSMVAGTFARALIFPGYLALCRWMKQFSDVYAALMLAGCIVFFLVGVAHHVICGTAEWFYIRMGKTEEARQAILEFFKKSSITMYVCYAGLLVFAVSLLAAVAGGVTDLPRWACLCNTLPVFLVLEGLRVVGAGNAAGALVSLGLAILI